MNKSRLSKSLLIASFIFVLAGASLLFWPTGSSPTNTQGDSTTSTSSPTSAGPIPKPQNVPTPKHLQKQEQTLESTSFVLQEGDSLSRILDRLGISNRQIATLIRADEEQVFSRLQPNQTLTVAIEVPSQTLKTVTLTPNRTEQHKFTYGGGAFRYEKHKIPVSTERLYKEVVIQTSLFVDGANAGIPDKILFQLTDIFRWDIDFALDIRQGDRFALVYDVQEIEGDVVGYGDIQVAQFINNGRVFEALRYDTQKRTDYFTVDGLSLRKAFIRTPVDFTRISSPFNPHRLHPIFKTTRPHQGADYAAPTGTEVQSAGDGTLSFVGQMTGYGNTIIIDHGHGFSTLYAHLNGFEEQMIAGRKVSQGQVIAFVGETGWATGPHLHYEFRINGQHQDPETITIPNDSPMNKQELRTFLPYAQQTLQRFKQRHSTDFTQALTRLRR